MRHMLLPSLRSTDAPNIALRPAGSFARPSSRRYGLGRCIGLGDALWKGWGRLTGPSPVTGSLRRQWSRAFRDGAAERLGGLKVDHEFDYGHLLHRQIGWFLRHCFHCITESPPVGIR